MAQSLHQQGNFAARLAWGKVGHRLKLLYSSFSFLSYPRFVPRVAIVAVTLALSSGVALGASGDLDPSWGKDGITRTLLERGPSRAVTAHVVTVMPSGAVLIQGSAGHRDGTTPFLARY